MANIPMTFACGLYDRMLALYTGEVQPEGIDLDFLAIDDPREIFDRMGKDLAFDACEMSSSEVISRHAAGRHEMVALPVFPSRVFRHGFITVNRKAVSTPKDLEGKRIGVPLYTQTAALFIRGLLQDEYGVDLCGVHWVQGATNSAESHGNPSAPPLLKPVSIELAQPAARGRRDPGHPRQRPAGGAAQQSRRATAVSGLPRPRARLLPAHAHFSDHASRRHPSRRL
jgi:4,5-dihydroxyphthalate decarboxylase